MFRNSERGLGGEVNDDRGKRALHVIRRVTQKTLGNEQMMRLSHVIRISTVPCMHLYIYVYNTHQADIIHLGFRYSSL